MKGEYTVYIDVYFLINFIMDYLVVLMTSYILKIKKIKWRFIISAVVGGIYSVLYITVISYLFITPLITFLFTIPMSIIAYGIKSFRNVIKNSIAMFFVTVLFGGLMNIAYYNTKWGNGLNIILQSEKKSIVHYRRFIFWIVICYFLMEFCVSFFLKTKQIVDYLYQVEFINGDKKVNVLALYDTGNSAREPCTGKMVHIVAKRIFDELRCEDNPGYFIIPYNSLGEKNGILIGMSVDRLVLFQNKSEKKVFDDIIIACYENDLSVDKNYEVILNRDILTMG